MWALIDIILNSKTPIYTYCTGYAMSTGFMIFIAGHKRYTSLHATFLCHQMLGGTKGTLTDMQQCIERREYEQNEIDQFILEHTKISQKKLNEIREKKIDWYISSNEAIELGIANEYI